ncbi:tRNA glutamyl-Q(34) synthetase GluQRS [Methyloceanibacter sp. wino2]|uniref:tRNA glutamyl-Q(34) synthetase GluQRS n=1 Tax=Methyloceanibacter sp. wino2 TaxID=2170729 RepID=UPI000D3E35A9|nr:tRNA glutamyl-Q(34) synthetase GluQRS [Methyloceanibacter sp. wino2]
MAGQEAASTGFVTRFAPSPTGLLHLGHAYSALTAWEAAQAANGVCLLRIEDTDTGRVRPEYEAAIYEDLSWLGLAWPEPVMRQSERHAAYTDALARLSARGLTYPCRCTRADIRAAFAAPQEGAAPANNAPSVYPGTCRGRPLSDAGPEDAIRLDLNRALHLVQGETLTWLETGPAHAGRQALDCDALRREVGDVVLARKDIGTAAYHLGVVVDDAAQGVTHVIRGADLLDATPIHRLLQALLDLPVPVWHHHALVRDENGKRLAKRDDARAIRAYRDSGMTPAEVRDLCRAQTV